MSSLLTAHPITGGVTNTQDIAQEKENAPADNAEALKTVQQKANANEVIQKLKSSIPALQSGEPVAKLTGNEFPKSNVKITQQVGDFFGSIGNKVFRKGFGEVILNERGVQTDIAHGLGRAKSVTFAAVPSVIENGTQIDYQPNWKGRGYDTYVFAAPVEVAGQKSYVAAVVRKDAKNQLYLHEVVDENGNVLLLNKKEDSIGIKNGMSARGAVTVAEESSSTPIIRNSAKNTTQTENISQHATAGLGEMALEAEAPKAEPVGTQTEPAAETDHVRSLLTAHPITSGVTNTQGAKGVLQAEATKKKAETEFQRYAAAANTTASERENARRLARGEIEMDDIGRRDRADVVQALAKIQRTANDANEAGIQGTRQSIVAVQMAKFKAMFAGVKDGENLVLHHLGEFGTNMRTPERVFKKVFGEKLGGELVEDIVKPIHYNESAKTQVLNQLFDEARNLGLNDTESALVHIVKSQVKGKNGKPVTVDDIKRGNIGPDSLPGWMGTKEKETLLNNLKNADAEKVRAGVAWYTKIYEEFHKAINEFRVSRGLSEVGYTENYMPNFEKDDIIFSIPLIRVYSLNFGVATSKSASEIS